MDSILNYQFNDAKLLQQALTHPSCAEQIKGLPYNYQRLEFLGDSVLSIVIAELLFQLYPHDNEGSLAKRHAALVCSEAVASVARNLNIGEFIRMTSSEHGSGGRTNTSNLEDVCEAIIGALYLDGGLAVAKDFIVTHWEAMARSALEPPKDAKTTLQEWAQARGLPLPIYQVIETTGPAHAPLFTIAVSINGKEPAQAQANAKRLAEQLAARALLDTLGNL